MGWISDLIGIGGHIVDYKRGRKLDQNRALVSRFNRQLDMFNLAMTKKHLDFDQRINKLLAAESLADAQQAQRQIDFYGTEAGVYALRRGLTEWMTGSRIREIEATARAELGTSWAQLGVERAQHRGQAAVLGARAALLDEQQDAQAEVQAAEMGQVGTQRVSAGARYAAQRAVVGGRVGAIGAERALVARGGAIRRQARIEQAAGEIGAGAVSGAARGMRGSYRRTEAMRAVRDLGRDLELFRLEDGLKMAQSTEALLKARAAGTDVERTFADEQARLAARETQLVEGGQVARAGFAVEEAQQAQAGLVRDATGRLLGAKERAWHQRYGMVGERIERARRTGAVEAAGHSLAEAGSRLQAGAAERTKAKAEIGAQKQTYEVWLGDTARQINRWQMQQLPTLPDYEGQGTRSALSTLLNIASEVID